MYNLGIINVSYDNSVNMCQWDSKLGQQKFIFVKKNKRGLYNPIVNI